MALTVRKLAGSSTSVFTILSTDDNKLLLVDNELFQSRARVIIDALVWSTEGWTCTLKRTWNQPVPVFVELPAGLIQSGPAVGLPYRVDEFYDFVPLVEPMADVQLFVADGRLWTRGASPWTRMTGERQFYGGGTFQMGRGDRNCVVKLWPSATNVTGHTPGNQNVILPAVQTTTGLQVTLGQENPSLLGSYLWFVNVDPPDSQFTATIFPFSDVPRSQFDTLNSFHGDDRFGLVASQGVPLKASNALGIYQGHDGAKIISRTLVGF